MALIDIGLYFIVIRRLSRISNYAERISQGEMDLEQIPASGNDEVARVTRSFHRMHTSLKKALDMLNG
jgi:HAMP domain-containing protein